MSGKIAAVGPLFAASFGHAALRTVGTLHDISMGTLFTPCGKVPALQCSLTTANFFPGVVPVDADADRSVVAPAAPEVPYKSGALPPVTLTKQGNTFTLNLTGPFDFVKTVYKVLDENFLVEVSASLHISRYQFPSARELECPTLSLDYDRLRSTEQMLRIARATTETSARQARLSRCIYERSYSRARSTMRSKVRKERAKPDSAEVPGKTVGL